MRNYLRLFKIIESKHNGFIKKVIFISVLLGLLPLFNIIAPKLIIDEYNGLRRFEVMFGFVLLALILNLANELISTYSRSFYQRTLQVFNDELAFAVNEKVLSLPIELTDSKSTQEKVEQALYGVGMTYALLEFLYFATGAVATGIVSIFILLSLNPLIPIFIIALNFLNKPFTKIIKENEKKYQENSAKDNRVYKYYYDFSRDYKYSKDIKIFNAEDMILAKAKYHMNQMFLTNHKYYSKNGAMNGAMNVINNLGVVGSFIYIVIKVIERTITIANFTLYFNCLNRLIEALRVFQEYYADLAGLNVALNSLYEFLDIDDSWNKAGKIDKVDLNKVAIEFKHVYFKYPTSEDYILEDCSFVINPGETVALVGRNGAGKSTIVKLLCKFYKPTSGEILLNGINISDIDTKYYYQILSPTFQDFRLFPFRIDENVASLKADDIDDASYKDMEKSFKLLNIKKWIDSLPKGNANYITTLFDKEGVQPSGGLGQKLALARSMHHKGKFIIMDEPTSALDPRSEQEIFENMLAITKDQTSLFISHRLSSTKYADRILVCNHGRIDEEGTHEELLKENKLYKEMFTTQAELYA